MTKTTVTRDKNAGFTLIELMVSMSVTLIGLAGLLTMHASTTQANRDSADHAQATELAVSIMESLQGYSLGQIAALYGTTEADINALFSSADSRWFRTNTDNLVDSSLRTMNDGRQFDTGILLIPVVGTSTQVVRLVIFVDWLPTTSLGLPPEDLDDSFSAPGDPQEDFPDHTISPNRNVIMLQTLLAREAAN